MNQQKIGRFLKEIRQEKGITQEQAAEQFGVAGRTVSRWETGRNMPDLSMLVEIALFYNVDVSEIIDGERKSERVKNEVNETMEKVADYAETINVKSMHIGVLTMTIVFLILVLISGWKEISSAPLVSMICAYNGATAISKAKHTKDEMDMITGVLCFIAMFLNTIVFILQ